MQMPGRNFSSASGYRFGFNGKEKDNELKGDGNSLDFGARMFDSRLGKFLSIDAAAKASWSVFKAFNDNPNIFTDPSGNTEFYFHGKWIGSDGINNNLIGIVDSRSVKKAIKKGNIPSEIKNGQKFSGGFAIDKDILRESNNVLVKALKEPEGSTVEHISVMKKDVGGYNVTGQSVGSGFDSKANRATGVVPNTEGDVLIHSHPVDATPPVKQDNQYFSIGFDASQPSKPRPDGTGGDMAAFQNFEINIIVGKNGESTPDINVIPNRKDANGNEIKNTSRLSISLPNRPNMINLFDKNANNVGSISKKETEKILKNEDKK
jgi:RHS repeat-associated protein